MPTFAISTGKRLLTTGSCNASSTLVLLASDSTSTSSWFWNSKASAGSPSAYPTSRVRLSSKQASARTKLAVNTLLRRNWFVIKSTSALTQKRLPPRRTYSRHSNAQNSSNSWFTLLGPHPPWLKCYCKDSATAWKINGTISERPSPKQMRQHCTYLKLSLSARSNRLKNLTCACTTEIQRKFYRNKSRNVRRHLPLITIELCSCSCASAGKNCFSCRSCRPSPPLSFSLYNA